MSAPLLHESFGWLCIVLGVVSGMALGTGFLQPTFLGGYAAPRRRLLRLGHISFFGLGGLNVLFAQTIAVHADMNIVVSSPAFIIAAVSMPLACALVAWRQRLFPVFAVPVAAALLATGSVAWELLT